jgi:hypothetical protein
MKTLIRALLVGLVLAGAVAAPSAIAASKDDCKNGGYASFRPSAGGEPFKNQGQCVSASNHGGIAPLVVPLACTSSLTNNTDGTTSHVTASCTGVYVLEVTQAPFGGDLFADVQPDGSASIVVDVPCNNITHVFGRSPYPGGGAYDASYPSGCYQPPAA